MEVRTMKARNQADTWTARPYHENHEVVADIAGTGCGELVALVYGGQAQADLVAAAPAMLDALRLAAEVLEDAGRHGIAVELRRVIGVAEGGGGS